MIDIEKIRGDLEGTAAHLARRGISGERVTELAALDTQWRTLTEKLEALRAQKNQANEAIAQATGKERETRIAAMRVVSTQAEKLTAQLAEAATARDTAWRALPNLLLDGVPDGGAADAVVLREVGKVPDASATPRTYLTLAEPHYIDIERAAKVSGSRFTYLKGHVARLELALIALAVDTAMEEGFTPVVPPVLVKEVAMRGMGYLEQAGDKEMYHTHDGLFLVGTSEQALGPLYMNETLRSEDMPLRTVGVSTCFRREAGSHGKDVHGIIRLHQFDKVELFSVTTPAQSAIEHEFLLAQQERLVAHLELPYRVVTLAAQDIGHPSAKTYDIETWLPGEGRYRETHSASNTTDYQARRLNIRLKDAAGATGRPHLLNATALAIPRILIALLENHQQPDGSVRLPQALHSYLPFTEIPAAA